MLDATAGVYYGLNAVAAAVWHFIQQPRRVEDVRAHVCSRFEVSPEQCAPDLDVLIAELVSRGLAEFVDGDAPAAG